MTDNTNVQTALKNIVTLGTWAKSHGHDVKHVRRCARAGQLESAFQFGRQWFMPKNANDVVPGVKSRGTSRTDGRTRYIVYATQTEIDAVLITLGDASLVVNPRDAARERRAARKLAALETETDVN